MYVIAKTFGFSAHHRLENLPDGHQCRNDHGHNYTVTLVIRSRHVKDRERWVTDYGEMAVFKAWMDDALDHGSLNDLHPQPTAEWLAKYIYDTVHRKAEGGAGWGWEWGSLVHTVVAQETDKTMAAYSHHTDPIIWTA